MPQGQRVDDEERKQSRTGIIDIHTHILPGVDDGAQNMETSMEMLRESYRQGVRAVIATPHYVPHHWKTEPEQIKNLLEKMVKEVKKERLPLQLYPGQEIQYFDGMAEMLQAGKLLTLAGSRYVLTEFLPLSPWSQIRGAVRKLTLAGYKPVLAHVERYQCLREPGHLEEVRNEGAYLQMNYGSLTDTGHFWNLRERADCSWCRRTLLAGHIHFLGTDMHGIHHRVPNSEQALAWIQKKGGGSLARKLAIENPEKIVKQEKMEK